MDILLLKVFLLIIINNVFIIDYELGIVLSFLFILVKLICIYDNIGIRV